MTKIRELYFDASKKSFENAIRLLEESKILHEYKRYARSYALSILSMEEISKTLLFRCVSVKLMEEKIIKKFIRDHENKIKHSQMVLIMLGTFVDTYDEIIKATEHDKTTEHKHHIFPDVLEKGVKESFFRVSNYFSNAHFTKLESIYVDVKEGKVLDPNIRIEQIQAVKAIEIIEKCLPFVKSIINLEDEKFISTMKDDIFGHMFKIDFD